MLVNFRDVGGCRTRQGHTVAQGLLYRSAEPSRGEGSEAVTVLGSLGVRYVIDLRAPEEVTDRPTRDHGWERIHLPLLRTIRQDWADPVDRTPAATGGRYYEYLREGRSSVQQILHHVVARGTMPALIHCVSGRDRTGIVIACVLDLLDVPDEAIAADYALSHVVDDDEGRHAHPDNMHHLLQAVRERHGSVETMLSSEGQGRAIPLAQLRSGLLGHMNGTVRRARS